MLRRVFSGRRFWPCLVLLTSTCLLNSGSGQTAGAVTLTPSQRERIKSCLQGQVADSILSFQLLDAADNAGKGKSDRKDSGKLGWSESSYLRNYMFCYDVSQDTYWLDKIVDHFDRMVSNMSDPDGDGYRGWRTRTYSVGIARSKSRAGAGGLKLEPETQRVYVRRGGERITGHTYLLQFSSDRELTITDRIAGNELAKMEYASPMKIRAVPGAVFTLEGPGKKGAAFTIETRAPEECEYQVHDGMVTFPVARFIEAVFKSPELDPKYREKAKQYAEILWKHFFLRWEKTWTDLPDGSGLYRFTNNWTQRFPDVSLPHNQYLALARTWLVLQDVDGLKHRDILRKRAAQMARYFKKHLVLRRDAYVWHYWDPLPEEIEAGKAKVSGMEDIGHGTIDISFAIEAANRGVVFKPANVQWLANTLLKLMWNRDPEKPRFGIRVDTRKKEREAWWDWMLLAAAEPRIWDLHWRTFESHKRAPRLAPSVVYVYGTLVGIDPAEKAKCRANTPKVLELARDGGNMNGGFELGWPGTDRPFGWNLTTWNPDQGGKGRWAGEGYRGRRSVELIGGGPKVNVLAESLKAFSVQGGERVVVSAFYRAAESARPRMSVISEDETGQRNQYEWSPVFPRSADWRQARWEVRLKPESRSFKIFLRNGGPGSVFWDAVRVNVEPVILH